MCFAIRASRVVVFGSSSFTSSLCFSQAILYLVRKLTSSSIENRVLSVLQPATGSSELSWEGMNALSESTPSGAFLVAVDTSLVATAGPQFERVLGFISLQPPSQQATENKKPQSNSQLELSQSGQIRYFAVSSNVRRKGIGKQLLQAIVQHASKQHISSVFIELNQHMTEALKVAQKEGFTEIGQTWSHQRAEATIRLAKLL